MTEKIKITRKVDGKDTELEIEESEILDDDVRVPVTPPVTTAEKTLKQSEVNALLAKERVKHDSKLKTVQDEYTAYKKSVEDKAEAAEAAAKEKVEKLRENLPEGIIALLDKLPAVDQLEWLNDPANIFEKKTISPLPTSRSEPGRMPNIGVIV